MSTIHKLLADLSDKVWHSEAFKPIKQMGGESVLHRLSSPISAVVSHRGSAGQDVHTICLSQNGFFFRPVVQKAPGSVLYGHAPLRAHGFYVGGGVGVLPAHPHCPTPPGSASSFSGPG